MDDAGQAPLARDGQDAFVGLVGVGVVSQLNVAPAHFRHVLDDRPVLADDHAGRPGRNEEAQRHSVIFVLGWVERVAIEINIGVRRCGLVRRLCKEDIK